ncbi:hypothetical protein E4U23_007845 [Claviceps purpurea]|nr:hypothetical protein E4U11_004871 [Claviceps purpurea]KAG6253344.1 hypothetical protein E4U23_007845 [Claviceps purpurea]KAG6310576.1 hypothetical protein E4U44_005373 [Claviceps purpurea]
MPVSWSEAEKIHWILGSAQMEKRGNDDSFPTTRVNRPSLQYHQQQDEQQQAVNDPRLEWSGDEEAFLFAYHRAGPAWPQERKNELCKLYVRLKSSMWANIGQMLTMPWEAVEQMHWHLGAEGMAEEPAPQAVLALAPPEPALG